jgi:hypothetical protein
MPSREEVLADQLIARAVDLLRFSAGEKAQIVAILQRMEEELIQLLQEGDLTEIGRRDKAALLRQAQAVISQYYGEASDEVGRSLASLGELESKATAAGLGAAFYGYVEPSLPTAEFFRRLVDDTLIQGAPSADWWKRQGGDVAFRFQTAVSQGLAEAETNAAIIKRVREALDVTRRNAAALVQTSVQTVANASRMETFQANTDLVRGVRQLSTLDGKTSLICIGYSGGKWKLDGTPITPTTLPFNGGPPRHWNCRSVLVPILATFKDLGINIPEPAESTRASMDGQVAAGTTFSQFLEGKSRGFTDDLLGVGRAELWRDGKITLSQLLDQTGRPLSLDELRARYDR